MQNLLKGIIQKADRYARNREYRCLFTGCTSMAIDSHSIPREACASALAKKGILFTRRTSFNAVIGMAQPDDSPNIVETGVNRAGVFKGYCPTHDMLLFRSAETTDRKRKNGMFIALHLRALSLEYSRRRHVIEFFSKVSELAAEAGLKGYSCAFLEEHRRLADCFSKVYLGSMFALIKGSDIDSIEFYCIPFQRNLQISCCGCFDAEMGVFESVIGYNLISYPDLSILALTNFTAVRHHLDAYTAKYPLPGGAQRLLNDIAFNRCEEPLIAVEFWSSLTDDERFAIGGSLRDPRVRAGIETPQIIKLKPTDLTSEATPALLSRVCSGMA